MKSFLIQTLQQIEETIMNTKIVYVVISTLKDVYFEQVWCSAYTALVHNSTCHLTLVCDEETLTVAQSNYRTNGLNLFKEIIPITCPQEMSNVQRSRYLKTNLRNIVRGDFLFLDSDTVVQNSLKDIDEVKDSVAMVIDMHEVNAINPIFKTYKNVYGEDYSIEYPYYNSGVIYAKDNNEAKIIFENWFENWQQLGARLGYTDQTPLAKTNIQLGFPIKELSGEWNCQTCNGVRYLHKARILHIFNHPFFFPTITHPLMLKETYLSIQREGNLTEELKKILLNAKSEFYSLSSPVGADVLQFLDRYLTMYIVYNIWKKNPVLFNIIEKISMFVYRRLVKFHITKPFKKWDD